MKEILLKYLSEEKELMEQLVEMTTLQKNALVKYDIAGLENITMRQWEISKEMRQVEDQRLTLISSWLGIKKADAIKLKLSDIMLLMKEENTSEFGRIKSDIRNLLQVLQGNFSLNRVLANRARNSIGELLHNMSNGDNHVCNVKI